MNRIRSRLRRWPPSWLCCWRWQGVPPLLQPRSRERPPKRSTPRENTPRRRSPPRWTAASLPPSYRCWTAFPRYRCIMTPKTPQRRFPGRGWLGNHRSLHRTSLSGRAGQNAGGNADRLLRRQRPVVVAAAETGGALTLYRVDSQEAVRTVLTDTPPAGGTAPYITDFAAALGMRSSAWRTAQEVLCSADCGRAERGYFRHDPSQRCGLYLLRYRATGCICATGMPERWMSMRSFR